MIVRTLQQIIDTERDVRGPVWASRRFLLAEDGVDNLLQGSDNHVFGLQNVSANMVATIFTQGSQTATTAYNIPATTANRADL